MIGDDGFDIGQKRIPRLSITKKYVILYKSYNYLPEMEFSIYWTPEATEFEW